MTAAVSLGAKGIRRSFRTGFCVEVDQLHVDAGTTLAILGPSGSGKSTLLSVLGLLEKPDQGQVTMDGRPVDASDRPARLSMAAVFQRPYLIKGTVASNVGYGLKLRGIAGAERAERVLTALRTVGLESFGDRPIGTLSGGEAQRAALARALVLEPRVLLLDEPLASLDPLLKRRLVADFARILKDARVTVVYVTHDHDEARVIADRIAVMNDGQIVAEGPAGDVMTIAPDPWVAEFLGLQVAGAGVVRSCEAGLVEIQAGSGASVFAAGEYAIGAEVRFSIPPEDVIVASSDSDLKSLSARNVLDGVVEDLEPRGATWRVTIALDGVRIASNISDAARRELGIEPDQRVTVVFKATAVRVAPIS